MCLGLCIETNWGAEPACRAAPWSASRRPAYPPPSSTTLPRWPAPHPEQLLGARARWRRWWAWTTGAPGAPPCRGGPARSGPSTPPTPTATTTSASTTCAGTPARTMVVCGATPWIRPRDGSSAASHREHAVSYLSFIVIKESVCSVFQLNVIKVRKVADKE